MNQSENSDDNQPSSPEQGIKQQANNSRFVSGQQATIGEDNIQIQGDNNFIVKTLTFLVDKQTTTSINYKKRLLVKVKDEVEYRLKKSLHNASLINLGIESHPQQVNNPLNALVKIGLKPPEPIPENTTILEVFDSVNGQLLILGEPGAGKTTTLLELAKVIIQRTKEKEDYPIPVLLNLSSWKENDQAIEKWKESKKNNKNNQNNKPKPLLLKWLISEIQSKHGFSNEVIMDWIKEGQLLLFLDGLDEGEPTRQKICVEAINELLQGEWQFSKLVVASRIKEYESLEIQLQLQGAIYLRSLTEKQIKDYLSTINLIEIWNSIKDNPEILDLVKIPLFLNITVLTYSDSENFSISKWQESISIQQKADYLLKSYRERMLKREISSEKDNINEYTFSREKTLNYLVILAKMLNKNSQTEFLIENINGSWLKSEIDIFIYKIWTMLIYVIFLFIIFTSIFWAVFNNYYIALLLSFLFSLYWGLIFFFGFDTNENIKNKFNVQHLFLRRILYRNGYIPWNYARFLDYCTERMLLQRVGGRYRFIHKLLQDHFAEMPKQN
ncbi:NACHT domain-containing protein [Nostoc sp. NZL]|uniref:NACHT domain-containing protein n=1 Tax=Nostoc sp. NZL TaxID=2650612 RepID=UPI0018C46182|nr:NACHT domain-containing protein [Nostoc sp. NZL]MBG1240551.1 NACHT domain-containing protein [Nostoc sp. NZL]